MGKSSPNATFNLFFAWVGLALGWGVRRFHNNMHIVSNPTEFRKSQTPYSCRCVLKPKADYYADPIPSFRFWSGRENKALSCKIETGFLCGDGARVIRFFARVILQLGFWTQKIQASVDYRCYVRRRAECTSLGPGLKHPSLRSDSSLAAKRRAEVLHVVFLFNKSSEPNTSCCSVFTLV